MSLSARSVRIAQRGRAQGLTDSKAYPRGPDTRYLSMNKRNLDLIQRWAEKPTKKAYIRSLHLRGVSPQNRALSDRIAAASKRH